MEKIIRVIAVISIVVGMSVVAAEAQLNPAANVSVPFAFTAGAKTFAAGNYKVAIVKSGLSAATLRLQRQGSKEIGTVLLQEFPGETSDGLDLVFGDVDGKKFLAGLTTTSSRYLLLGGSDSSAQSLTSITKQNKRSKM